MGRGAALRADRLPRLRVEFVRHDADGPRETSALPAVATGRRSTGHLQTDCTAIFEHPQIARPRAEDEPMPAARFQIHFVQTPAAVADGSAVRTGEVFEMQRDEAAAAGLDRNREVMRRRRPAAARAFARDNAPPYVEWEPLDMLGGPRVFGGEAAAGRRLPVPL
jgi:hypothetical protein